jgi:MFS family permease
VSIARPPRNDARLTALLCAASFGNTFSIGAFPALLPELAREGLADWQLGLLGGAMGLSRMAIDVPAGLLISRNLGRTFVVGVVGLAASVLILGSGGPFPVLVLGRVLMGMAHTLAMLSALTTILRYQGTTTLGAALNASELSAILGMLGGAWLLGLLPAAWPWNLALLVVCSPQIIGLALAPALVRSLRGRDQVGVVPALPAIVARELRSGSHAPVALAFAAGALAALAYSTIELFLLPRRGSRELGLDRTGVTRLLMTAQACDIVVLIPAGVLADRVGAARMVGGVLVLMAASIALVAFGDLPLLTIGVVLLGCSMSGWMLPLALIRQGTPGTSIGWRTALYRVGVDGAMFLGPVLSGALARHHADVFVAGTAALLVALGVALLSWSGPPRLPEKAC